MGVGLFRLVQDWFFPQLTDMKLDDCDLWEDALATETQRDCVFYALIFSSEIFLEM